MRFQVTEDKMTAREWSLLLFWNKRRCSTDEFGDAKFSSLICFPRAETEGGDQSFHVLRSHHGDANACCSWNMITIHSLQKKAILLE